MKEIMVIKDEQAIDEWNRTIAQFIDVDNKIYKAEFIKVPETFEELKKLCKKTGHYAVNILKGGLLNKEYIFIFGLSFRDNGDIEDIENNNVAENRTPQQMWQIIKSLIGEE